MEKQSYKYSKEPVVSVIMNCLNCSRYLREAINSVYSQTYDDWKIIFWDNASTDNSAKIAKGYDNKLCYFRGEKTVPLGHARNLAIKKTRGKYIAFLDCDDIWLPEKLERQVELLDSNNKLGLVFSDNYVIDGFGNLKKKSILPNKMFRGNVFSELFYHNFIPFLTVVLRKEAINRVGMFNHKYEIAEEYDLFLRIAEYYPVDFVEESLAKYRIHDGNFSKDIRLGVAEDLQIMNYWLDKKPELRRELRGKILLKKTRMFYNVLNNRFLKR